MPGAVPHTSTYGLTDATLPYVMELAGGCFAAPVRGDPPLAWGVNVHEGRVTNRAVAEAHGLHFSPPDALVRPD